MGLLARHARSPSLHFATALSFSVCVQGRSPISASRSARFSRVRLAIIWLSPQKSAHSKEIGSKHVPTGSHASQHRMSVPRCNAVEAVNNWAPRLSGVLRESSRLLAFPSIISKSASAPNWGSRVLMSFVKPLQNGTEDGMFGHPTWDASTLMNSRSRFLNNHTYSCVVTRYGPLPQVLQKDGSSNGSRALEP